MELVCAESTEIPIRDEERPAWREAAETWRLPYWDPAVRRSYNDDAACIPKACMDEMRASTDFHNDPFGTMDWVENPLHSYRYPLREGETLKQYGMEDIMKDDKVVVPVSFCNAPKTQSRRQ